MAVDSLLGGNTQSLDGPTRDVLTGILGDNIPGSNSVVTVPGGAFVSSQGDLGNTQGALLATTGSATTIVGGVGSVVLPQGSTFAYQGPTGTSTPTGADAYFEAIIKAATGSNTGYAANLSGMANLLTGDTVVGGTGGASGGSSTVRVASLADSSPTTTGTIGVTGTAGQILVLDATNLPNTNKTIQVSGTDKVGVAGNAKVVISGSAPTTLAADLGNQSLTGGSGNDTIAGGGGSDTLAGGAGSDTFVMPSGAGNNTVISDFTTGTSGDKLQISAAQLAKLSGFSTVNGNAVATFSDGSTITFTGVAASALTIDILKIV